MNDKLNFAKTIADAVAIGVKNVPSILGAVVLWLVTIWIPYLNVGTTIAITTLPIKLSRGEVINPLSIFDSNYRHQMGEYFILNSIMASGILIAMCFMLVPAIVLSMSWSMAVYLLLDKNMNWAECLTVSNRLTMGYKFKMFLITFAYCILVFASFFIFAAIADAIDVNFVTFILMFFLIVATICSSVALEAVFYRELVLKQLDAPEKTTEELA